MKRLVFIIVALMAIVTAEAGKQYTKKSVQYDVLTVTTATGNVLVFSASQGTETAFVDEEHAHGRFTYFLLKHLRATKGDTTIGSMVEYVKDQVMKASVMQNDGKVQTPTPNASFGLGDKWKEMKLK